MGQNPLLQYVTGKATLAGTLVLHPHLLLMLPTYLPAYLPTATYLPRYLNFTRRPTSNPP